MRPSSLFLTALLICPSVLAQPDPSPPPAIPVSDLRVSPENPTENDTLTISFKAWVVSACGYEYDFQVGLMVGDPRILPPGKRRGPRSRLDLHFALPANAPCTADLPAYRTLTVRIPPLPAGEYALFMRGSGRSDRTDFVNEGPAPLFLVKPVMESIDPFTKP
jgi:hypothetical protein